MGEPFSKNALLRSLPSVDELQRDASLQDLLGGYPRPFATRVLREAVALARSRLLSGGDRPFGREDAEVALRALTTPALRPLHNATGVVLHTNLGRAPLAEEAVARMAEVARGYCNLEYDLGSGARGSRCAPVVDALCELTGAEDALVVNNGAAALLLALAGLAAGKEGIISRGELVEIGGGFRIPEVMTQSGVRLREVGTTNRTHLMDYRSALGPDRGVLLRVHRSNFAQVGYIQDVPLEELATLAAEAQVPLVVDMGSGQLEPLVGAGLTSEPTMRSVIAAGADVVTFSGDKLLGGPQAGVVVGRRRVMEPLKGHPLSRALRVDKLVVAALEATLGLYREGRAEDIPVRALLQQRGATLRARAGRLQDALARRGVSVSVVETEGQVGGGTMPLAAPASFACAVPGGDALLASLRRGAPPVIARISEGQVLLDVRCLVEGELSHVAQAVQAALLLGSAC